jgi:hypothetical protein
MPEQFSGVVAIRRTLQGPIVVGDDSTGQSGTILLDGDTGDIRVGGSSGQSGNIRIYSQWDVSNPSIHLDGAAGDILLQGGDCAEALEIADGEEESEPGSVMVFDEDGRLRRCSRAYDRMVAGIVSGANLLRPGIILSSRNDGPVSLPIALIGKVYCRVDARQIAIDVGDLLTTSDLPGHAMKAADQQRAFGAVLGKALAPLTAMAGLVPVLVGLQ